MLEAQVEAYLVQRVKGLGGVAYKFTSPNRRSVPDRMVVLPGGRLFFIELKATGKRPTPGQWREMDRLRVLGQSVCWADSKETIDTILENWRENY